MSLSNHSMTINKNNWPALLTLLLTLLIFSSSTWAGSTVVANDTDYKVMETEQFHLIYALELSDEAQHAHQRAVEIQKKYQQQFSYPLDEALTIGLLSNNNQYAQGFSTQSPFNMQMNYLGGTQHIDYFSASSWLDTLLYHETAHNYQTNAKNNAASRFMNDYLGNNGAPLWLTIVPFFTSPNSTLPTILLEGNAVLNESWHGNGGRLYSGRARALFLSQLKAKKITPTRLINSHLDFPYGEEKYLIGGFFWLYLSEQFGLNKTNQFYLSASSHFINPFQTNQSFIEHFGISFEQAVEQFNASHQEQAKKFKILEGESIAQSQFAAPLNHNSQEVLFITADGKTNPILHKFSRSENLHQQLPGHWKLGKPFVFKGEIATAASGINTPERLSQGLFDQDGFIIAGTQGKMVQSINSKGQAVWFDVAHSFNRSKLMQGKNLSSTGQFVEHIHSSALLNEQAELFYFKQKGPTRTLYRNKTALLSYQGYYGFVVNADKQGQVCFIAPSQYGSSLFCWKNGQIHRLSTADNIIDARHLSNNRWLATTINSNHIQYMVFNALATTNTQAHLPFQAALSSRSQPFEYHFLFDSESEKALTTEQISKPHWYPPQDYELINQTRFSSFTPELAYHSVHGTTFKLQLNFTDPLRQNAFSLFATRDNSADIYAGTSYLNTRHRLEFGGELYGVSRNNKLLGARNYGANLFAQYALYQQGNHYSQAKLNATANDEFKNKNPVSVNLGYWYQFNQALQLYANQAHHLSSFAQLDRGDQFLGIKSSLFSALPYGFYVGANGKYVDSNVESLTDARGIKFTDSPLSPSTNITDFEMAGLNGSFYAKTGWQAGGTIKKQIDVSLYFFTFPISLRRQALYLKGNHFEASNVANEVYRFNETTAGLTLDVLLLNKFAIPISIEFIHNDGVLEQNSYRILFDF